MIAHYLLNPYLLRLVCFSLASFFLIHSVLAFATWLGTGTAIRFAERLRPRFAAGFILALRLLPFGLAFFAVAGLCVPSYLWLEPKGTDEQVSLGCWIAALLCVLALGISFARFFRALSVTLRYTREREREGREIQLPDGYSPLLVIDSAVPVLALAGLLWPRIVVSSGVLRELSCEQLDAALRHERAHWTSRDNLKRLLMLLAPDVLPFCHCSAALEQCWARFAEWSADDQAAARDSRRSLSLASALVRVARMGAPLRSTAGLPICFVADSTNLSSRVDRLLNDQSAEDCQVRRVRALVGAIVLAIGVLGVTALQPSTLYSVHRVLEHLVR